MHITTDGIVLRERAIDEFDCVLTLLTRERGIISAYARGAKKPRGTLRVPAELLSYSCFVLFSNRERYSVDKADLDTVFMGVRGDVEKLSLASYFCELTAQAAPREENADGYLRLLLNTLYLLDTGKRACGFLKPVYELRLLTMAGFMPNLVACAGCGCYEAEEMFFLPQSAQLACGECVRSFPADQVRLPLGRGVLAAMRHILYSEAEKLFSFSLPGPALARLEEVCECYTVTQLERRFDTLDFYRTMKGTVNG